MKPVNFSDVDIANIVEAVIKDDPDAIVIKDSLAKSLAQLREGRYAPVSEVSQVRQKQDYPKANLLNHWVFRSIR